MLPGWPKLTQVIFLPQIPEWLGLQVHTTVPSSVLNFIHVCDILIKSIPTLYEVNTMISSLL
jgi:hypothetical protein